MHATTITFQGWLGNDVTLRRAGDVPVANFRVACTPRRFNRKSGSWEDAPTQWYAVSAWRALAENCADSLRRGDPVVVHGRLNAAEWTNSEGSEMRTFEVEALLVGHDLARGTSEFTRTAKAATPDTGVTGADAAAGQEVAA